MLLCDVGTRAQKKKKNKGIKNENWKLRKVKFTNIGNNNSNEFEKFTK